MRNWITKSINTCRTTQNDVPVWSASLRLPFVWLTLQPLHTGSGYSTLCQSFAVIFRGSGIAWQLMSAKPPDFGTEDIPAPCSTEGDLGRHRDQSRVALTDLRAGGRRGRPAGAGGPRAGGGRGDGR